MIIYLIVIIIVIYIIFQCGAMKGVEEEQNRQAQVAMKLKRERELLEAEERYIREREQHPQEEPESSEEHRFCDINYNLFEDDKIPF